MIRFFKRRGSRFNGIVSRRLACMVVLAIGAVQIDSRFSAASSADSLEVAEEQAFRQAAQAVAPSVVRIQTVGGVDRVGEFLTGTAATTGVIVSKDGFIVSSAFNFIAKPTSILIQLGNGRPLPARLVATDRLRMLTLLKIESDGLIPLIPRDNKPLRPGQWVIAVGRTYDSPSPSVSVGIISAINRVWGKAIQTDAKVSPVNYGGPLVDIAGNVLGVVVPLSPSGKEETAGVEWYDSGIGFAIPFSDVLASVERLKGGKDQFPGLLGITFKEHGIEDRPAIDHVRFDSPADRAGLKARDVLLEIDGRPVRRHDEVRLALGGKYAGDTVAVVLSRGKEHVRTQIKLVDALPPFDPGFLGILPERQATDAARGVTVRFVFPGSAAAGAGITVGDRIRKWNGTVISEAEQFASLVRRVRPQSEASAVVVHGAAESTVKLTVGKDTEEVPKDLARPTSATSSPAPPRAPAAVKEAAPKPKTGHYRDKLLGDTSPSFWAYVPDSYSEAGSWGLLVWFGPAPDSMEATILSRWQGLCEERRLIILAPQPAEAIGFSPNDLVGARQVVEHFLSVYRINKSRIVAHGFGPGGAFASQFALENREHVRGLALASGLLAGAPPEGHPSNPLRFFFSSAEGERIGDRMRRAAEILRRLKFPVTIQTTSGGERLAYPTTPELAEMARWIDTLDRI